MRNISAKNIAQALYFSFLDIEVAHAFQIFREFAFDINFIVLSDFEQEIFYWDFLNFLNFSEIADDQLNDCIFIGVLLFLFQFLDNLKCFQHFHERFVEDIAFLFLITKIDKSYKLIYLWN